MKIIMILATGALLTFTPDPRTNPECFTQGYEIMKKITFYDDGWILKDSNIEVGGWYCQ